MNEVFATWKARRRLRRCKAVGEAPRVLGNVWIHGEGEIVVGDRVVFDGSSAPIELHAHAGSTIVLGDRCRVESGASIEATRSIRIGARCHLGAFCRISDSYFHSLERSRHDLEGTEVVLEDDVVVAPRAVALAGARVGRGSYVCAAAVVRRRVPAGLLVRGNPAAVARTRLRCVS